LVDKSATLADAITKMEGKQFTRSFFAPSFIEAGFDTHTPLTEHLSKLEK
jgi:hypothetical protein